VDHLEAAPLMANHLATTVGAGPVTIVSPDIGGAKRAQRLQELLAARLGREVASRSSTSAAAAAWSPAATSWWARSKAATRCSWTTSSAPARP